MRTHPNSCFDTHDIVVLDWFVVLAQNTRNPDMAKSPTIAPLCGVTSGTYEPEDLALPAASAWDPPQVAIPAPQAQYCQQSWKYGHIT